MERGDEATVRVDTVAAVDIPGAWVALVAVELRYRSQDPLAVEMVMRAPGEEEIAWTFSWELLARGRLAESGEGDVRIRPAEGVDGVRGVEVALAPSFAVCVRLPERDVALLVGALQARRESDLATVAAALDAELAVIMADA
ncbi:SsgA family sporulation/cell division regulator [Streptomyces sp. NPDC049040]|uniref:SsgA family sporulation/cell division regulator n=1 Tax=Streptomyces sp. NPDC049040 TaxID=3365593 RepID=UPI0037133FF4